MDRVDEDYFRQVIRPLLSGGEIEFVGEVTVGQKAEFLSGAHALLPPIDWPEPFGLVTIEAMVCGTPVVAFNRGAVPQVLTNGLTGFAVEDASSAVSAVEKARGISRDGIRRKFEMNFTGRRIAADYVSVYRSLGLAKPSGLGVVG